MWPSSSPHNQANKKARVLVGTQPQLGAWTNSSSPSPSPESPLIHDEAVATHSTEQQVPLLDQYREVLGNLNGRVFGKAGSSNLKGGFVGQKENRSAVHRSESCYRKKVLHTGKPLQLNDEGPWVERCQAETQAGPSTPSVQPLSLSQPRCLHRMDVPASWQESQTNLHLNLHEVPLSSQPTKDTHSRMHIGRSVDQQGDESDDDADLFFDWRGSGGAARNRATIGAGSSPVQGPDIAGRTTPTAGDVVRKDYDSNARCQSRTQNGSPPNLDLDYLDEQSPSISESDSQEGALSQLLEMVDGDDAATGTNDEHLEFLGSGRQDSETSRQDHTKRPPGAKAEARLLSEAERSRFILEASQTVLTVSDEKDLEEEKSESEGEETLECPVCGVDLQQIEAGSRDAHTNRCLDGAGEEDACHAESAKAGASAGPSGTDDCNRLGLDYAPLVLWLDKLQLGRYAAAFVKEEVDFDSLHCLKEEDLDAMGVVALGPKRKLLAAIEKIRDPSGNGSAPTGEATPQEDRADETPVRRATVAVDRRITDFFPAPNSGAVLATAIATKGLITSFFTTPNGKKLPPPAPAATQSAGRGKGAFVPKKGSPPGRRGGAWKQVSPDPPEWHLVPGTDFRVDAFRFQSPHCRHWFLSHFHADHYQGLTRNFRHGPIFCTPVTARLVHMKLGVPLETLHAIPLGERTRIDNCHVTLLEANHCPGAAMMLFEPDGAKPTLHTGDFRYCPAMARYPALQKVEIGTLILDTTYCDPQYDFPAQDDVIQFVIDAIQAETFNPKTLFLIGAYTIGKERVFLEVARALNTKIYVGAARRKVLACLDLPAADMARLTTNENESNVHVVPLWSLANFKRMNSIAKHYQGRYNTVVSFSPTGWSFGRGKRRSTGTRRQQGTIVRYEVPYSEHSSFSELRAFVRVVKPAYILPHVNNDGGQKAKTMIAELLKAREPGLP